MMGVMCDMKCAHKTGPALDDGVALDERGEEESKRLGSGELGPDVVEGDVAPGLADEGAGEVGAAAVEGEDVAEDLPEAQGGRCACARCRARCRWECSGNVGGGERGMRVVVVHGVVVVVKMMDVEI